MKIKTAILLAGGLLTVSVTSAFAAEDMESRVARLERMVNSQGLVDVLLRLDNMQAEVQHLRGEIELQRHQLDEMKKRQRDLYLDVDRRLLELERRSLGASAALPATVASTASSEAAAATTGQPATATVTVSSSAEQAPAVNEEEERAAYEKAFDLLYTQRYDHAMEALRQFLKEFPEGRYAHMAQYWLAEAGYSTGKFKQAIQDYQILIEKYQNSSKRAEAMLKIGYSYSELKDHAKAEQVLQQLIDAYPNSTESGQAKNQLKKIRLKKSQ